MKRLFAGILILTMSISLCIGVSAEDYYVDDNSVGLIINEEWTSPDQPPILENDRTLAPLRAVAEKLDFEMGWDEEAQKVTATKDDISIVMYIGQKEMTKNDVTVLSDVAPSIVNGRTMIPVRILAELLDCDVEWNDDSHTAFVNSPMAYEYYNGLTYFERAYRPQSVVLTGYLGKVVSQPNEITSMTFQKPYIVLDMKSDFSTGDNVFCDVKRVELDLSDTDADVDSLLGKRVAVTGKAIEVDENAYHSYPFVFKAEYLEEDEDMSEANYQEATRKNIAIYNEIDYDYEYCEYFDFDNDGTDEVLVFIDDGSSVTLDMFCYANGGVQKINILSEEYRVGSYTKSGTICMKEKPDYVILRNGFRGADDEKYIKLTINSDKTINIEHITDLIEINDLYMEYAITSASAPSEFVGIFYMDDDVRYNMDKISDRRRAVNHSNY